jgi:hypothetical protein
MHDQMLPFLPPLRTFAAAALLAVPSFADVYIVDDDGGPGVDFTDLPAATASAAPGDVLLVQPGNYSGFSTANGIAVLGQGDGVHVTSPTFIVGVPAGQVLRLADLDMTTLDFSGCSGVVVLDGVTALGNGGSTQALFVGDCADVRVIGSKASFSQAGWNSGHGLWSQSARVECVDTKLYGRSGINGSGTSSSGSGGSGVRILSGSRAHLVLCEAKGGSGGPGSILCFPFFGGGNGGDGIRMETSTLWAMGEPSVSVIVAGAGGSGNPNCSEGFPGFALRLLTGSYMRHSGQSITGAAFVDGTSTLASPPLLDPYLQRFGTAFAGTQVRFNVYGEAGDEVTLFLGRNAVVQPLPGVLVEKLTSEERAFPLGPIPTGGFATFLFNLPPTMTAGFTFYAQARVMRDSQELRTNSTPVVVR